MLREITRVINLIVVHCSASPDGASLVTRNAAGQVARTPVQEINAWHAARGFLRDDDARQRFNPSLGSIGYHLVIYRNGAVATGRAFAEVGAHARGHNAHSLGICMIGTERFSAEQWASLANMVADIGHALRRRVVPLGAESDVGPEDGDRGVLRLCGHRDLSPDVDGDGTVEPHEWLKTCPGFDVRTWFDAGMTADPAHVWKEAA